MEEERIVIGQPRPALNREQKVGLSFIIICGLGTLVLGGLYVWRHMAVPFVVDYKGPKLLVGDQAESAEVLKQKNTDTDGDTISDYDETAVYKTSPYLADSDSDGSPDNTEITSGKDPNCATGDACDSLVQDEDALRPEGGAAFVSGLTRPVAPTPPAEMSPEQAGQLSTAAIEQLKALPTSEIRTLLISSGAEADKINKLSDGEVRDLYLEILASISANNE